MTQLSKAELEAIAEWLDARQVYIPTSEVRKLYDAHQALADRLVEMEGEMIGWKEKAGDYESQYGELWDVIDALGMDHDSTDSVPETVTEIRAALAASHELLREITSFLDCRSMMTADGSEEAWQIQQLIAAHMARLGRHPDGETPSRLQGAR